MRIERIELIHLCYHYDKPFVYGGGTCTGRLTSLVFLHADNGLCGIGSIYSHPGMVEIVVKQQLEPILVGKDPTDIESLWQLMYGVTRWYGRKGAAMSTLGGIDTALWDLKAKAADKPLRKLLSSDARSECPAYASALLWQDVDALADEAGRYVEQGFRRMKMRAARSDEYDVAGIRAVRRAIGPRNDLMVDGVMHYDLATARRMASVMADNRVFWFEEPFPPEDPDSYLALGKDVGVRVALGENEFGVQGFAPWIRSKIIDIVQPDVSRCGGISEAWKTSRLALEYGIDVAPHTWSDAVAVFANAQLVAAIPNGITVEVDRTGNPFIDELLVEPLKICDGMLRLSDAPGLGIQVRRDVLDRYRLDDPFQIPDGNYSDFAFGAGYFRPATTHGGAA